MISRTSLVLSLERFVNENGRYPLRHEFKDVDYLYSASTYRRELGSYSTSGILEAWYRNNPLKCKHCLTPLSFEERNKKVFCNRSCSASYNNSRKEPKGKAKVENFQPKLRKRTYKAPSLENSCCIQCNVPVASRYKYCSLKCHAERKFQNKLCKWLIDGETSNDNRIVRRHIAYIRGYNCEVCGISEWNGKEITLEVDHVDGNSENSSPQNLRLICPNCHSQTSTYKGRNKGNGRFSRWQRYQEGKSY